jgi:hypothetical protein
MPPVLEMNQPSSRIAAVQPSALLAQRLRALGRRHVSVAVLTGVALTLSVAVELLALELFFDWWLDLPWHIRLLLFALQTALFAYLIARLVIWPLLRRPGEDDLALMIERARPVFRSRLIASLQLARPGAVPPGASPGLAVATIRQTEELARSMEFGSIVSTDRLKQFGTMAALVLLMGFAGLGYGKATAFDLLKRAFLSHVPVPRKTHIFVQNGDKLVGIGDNVRLEAFVGGIIPSHGKVEVRYRTRRAQAYSLEQNKDDKTAFGRTIENVQESFNYLVYLNDGVSETYQVKAIPRPTVATIECEQQYPAYTGIKPAKRSLGDLSLLAGSRLKLQAVATKSLRSASIKLAGTEREIPMQLSPENSRAVSGEFAIPAKGLTGFSIQMLDTDGMESRDAAIYRIDLVPDKAPVVRITYPDRKEELITRQATMIVGIDATDDFQISKVRLKYKIIPLAPDLSGSDVQALEPPEPIEKSIDLDLEGQSLQRLRRRHEWKIGEFRPLLPEGTAIEYWVEAEDNNNVTGPGIGVTEHQLAKVVSESDKRADLLNRAGDYLGSINDVATDQEKLNRNLGNLIREKAGSK